MKKIVNFVVFAVLSALLLFLMMRLSFQAERIAMVEGEILPSVIITLVCPLIVALAFSLKQLKQLFSKGRLRFNPYACYTALLTGGVVAARYFSLYFFLTEGIRALVFFTFFYAVFHILRREPENDSD